MVEGNEDKVVTYANSETGFGGLRIVKRWACLIYISDTTMVEGHRWSTISHIIYINIAQRILIQLLDLQVKP